MYCRNCGTVVPGNEELCEACRMEQIIQRSQTPRPDMSKEGRGAAIAAVILSAIGLILSIAALVTLPITGSGAILFLFASGLACAVISIINGIRGISAFRLAGRKNAVRPVASLVCGIVSLNLNAVALIYWFVIMLTFAVML